MMRFVFQKGRVIVDGVQQSFTGRDKTWWLVTSINTYHKFRFFPNYDWL